MVGAIGLALAAGYVAAIVWVYTRQPQTVAEATGALSASVGAYRVDAQAFADGLGFFHADQPPKGPFLGGVAAKYSRPELCESILKPSAKIAQGFESQWFKTKKGEQIEGFVTREAGDEVELRNILGVTAVVKKSDIKERGKREISVMPEALLAKSKVDDLASLLAFLESLKGQ